MFKHNQSGFSLTETLIAVAVVGIGFIGLAKLHTEITQETGQAKDKLLALNLMQEKIADLKQFDAVLTADSQVAYQAIGNNTGGNITSGTYDGFNLSWCVNSNDCQGSAHQGDYYYTANSSAPTTTSPGGGALPDFKKVKLIVSWTNRDGVTESLTGETIIIPKLSKDSGMVINTTTVAANENNPDEVVDDVPDDPTGDGDNPEPANTRTVEHNNDVYVYNSDTDTLVSINGVEGNY